jgi:thioredoxin 1
MSGTDDSTDEREAIREKKRERLRRELDGDDADGDGTARTPGEPVHVDGPDQLQELVADHRVVLVDFYADWCGPCQQLEPIVESIAADTGAVVAKVDVDRHQGLAREANVRGVPTLVLYADGSLAERLVGLQNEGRLRSLVEDHLSG